jgi:hypothetical protein
VLGGRYIGIRFEGDKVRGSSSFFPMRHVFSVLRLGFAITSVSCFSHPLRLWFLAVFTRANSRFVFRFIEVYVFCDPRMSLPIKLNSVAPS